jgi:hypothetical protein
MLPREENDMLTLVSPDKPMGKAHALLLDSRAAGD